MTAAEIFRKLRADGSIHTGEVSQSTVERFVRCIIEEAGTAVTKDMRRYEKEHINEVWCGDTCYGPYLEPTNKVHAHGRQVRGYVGIYSLLP